MHSRLPGTGGSLSYRSVKAMKRNKLVYIGSIAISLVLLLTLIGPPPAQADIERSLSTPTAWWWLHGVTATQITDLINDEGARLVDLEVESSSPWLFSAAFVKNSGEYGTDWWWLTSQTVTSLSNFIAENDARIIDLERYSVIGGGTQYAAVLVRNSGSYAKSWWWWVGQTQAQVSSLVSSNNARIVDLESYVIGTTRYFDVVTISNTGADASSWWWYWGQTASGVTSLLNSTGARILDLDTYLSNGTRYFNVVLKSNPQGTNWWWWWGQTAADVSALIEQHGSRIIDVQPYWEPAGTFSIKKFAVAMINNSNALTTDIASDLGYGSNGATGLYLKEVGGPVHASLNTAYAFEPASTLKIIHHLHAMREVYFGNDDLDNNVVYSGNLNGSCPIGGSPFESQTLRETLRRMMWYSDNAATKGISDRFGAGAIELTANFWAGMTETELNHTLGCGPPNGDPALSNRLSLRNAASLFEGVAQGVLINGTARDDFYDLMQSDTTPPAEQWWFTTDLRDIVNQEAASLGIPDAANSYWANVELAWKPGGYTLCWPTCEEYRSVAGYVSLPTCNGSSVNSKEYVFGLFIDEAVGAASADNRLGVAAEMFRDLIRSSLATCPTDAPPATAVAERSVYLEANVPNPFNPSTSLRFNMSQPGVVRLSVFDLQGRKVRDVVNEWREAGSHSVPWNGKDGQGVSVASGAYIVRAETADGTDSRKVILTK